jgi:hypothetical protein
MAYLRFNCACMGDGVWPEIVNQAPLKHRFILERKVAAPV